MFGAVNGLFKKCESWVDIPPLAFRLVLAYGFFWPAVNKIQNFSNVVAWFESMQYFFPYFSAILAAGAEAVGVLLLVFGLGTRLISVALMFVMMVAIWTVHWTHGFSSGSNGFEIPLYYFLMLFSLLVTGPGRFSVDACLEES